MGTAVLKRFFSNHPKLTLSVLVLAILIGLAWLVVWDLSHECVRWTTRIDVDEYGGVRRTPVCVEFQPRWREGIGN